jgi:hypothetical protein
MARVTRRPPRPIRSGPRPTPAPLLAVLALAFALLVAGVPMAAAGAAAETPSGGPGLASTETTLLLAAPTPAGPLTGTTGRTFAAAAVVLPFRPRRGRPVGPGRRPAVHRGTAQRWYAMRLLDGG